MTAEEIASYHRDRPGYELVDYVEVVLPIYKIYMTASLLLHTPLTPMYEFVLRAIRLGIDDADELSECLGIPVSMVTDTLSGLHQSEEVSILEGVEGPKRFVLTRKGEVTTTSLERIRPEKHTVPVLFDGLTRMPIEPPAMPLLSGRQPEDLGIREIPAMPGSRIEVADIDIAAAARLLARERSGEGRRDLLAIKSIERRMRLHMPAVALLFKETDGEEVELLFANETEMLADHNRAFALAEGAKKTRLLAELGKTDILGPNTFARRLANLKKKSVDTTEPTGTKRTLRVKPAAMAEGSVTSLSVLDHPPLLLDAIATAKKRVLIICPWITSAVVDSAAIRSITKLLKDGRELHIGYGIDEDRPKKGVPEDLITLSEAFPNFHLVDFGDTHEKILIKDDEFMVSGSFNWLSFRGDARRRLRREHGTKVSDPAYIEKEYAKFEARFRTHRRANLNKE